MSVLERTKFDILGEKRRQGKPHYARIGEALFCCEASGLSDKSRFLLRIDRPPINFERTWLSPQRSTWRGWKSATFRLCASSEKDDGFRQLYGVGRLVPRRDGPVEGVSCYELVPDAGTSIWQCGRFVAELNPQRFPDFFTVSDAA